MRKINEFKEERNYLLKVRIYHSGNNQWRLVPRKNRKDGQVNKGEINFRGTDEEFAKFLRKIQAKDHQTDPPSIKNRTYMQMVQSAKDLSDPWVWVWNKNWKATNKIINNN